MTALSTAYADFNVNPSPSGESSPCITMQSAAAVDSPRDPDARRAAERAEDAEDARHKRTASPTPWQALGLDPDPTSRSPGRSVVTELGTLRWQDEATCREAPPDDAERFTEVRTQAEAEPLVSTYCSTCPVRLRCLAEGRALRGWGVFGGVALVDGLRAREGGQQQPRTGQSATPARAWLVAALADGPQRRVELVAAASEAGIGSRTLDSAARAHAVVSTRRPGDPGAWWSLPGDVNAAGHAARHGSPDRAAPSRRAGQAIPSRRAPRGRTHGRRP